MGRKALPQLPPELLQRQCLLHAHLTGGAGCLPIGLHLPSPHRPLAAAPSRARPTSNTAASLATSASTLAASASALAPSASALAASASASASSTSRCVAASSASARPAARRASAASSAHESRAVCAMRSCSRKTSSSAASVFSRADGEVAPAAAAAPLAAAARAASAAALSAAACCLRAASLRAAASTRASEALDPPLNSPDSFSHASSALTARWVSRSTSRWNVFMTKLIFCSRPRSSAAFSSRQMAASSARRCRLSSRSSSNIRRVTRPRQQHTRASLPCHRLPAPGSGRKG
eukprot:scaffold12970_cov113-Isochrysis_galbana.AAC.7